MVGIRTIAALGCLLALAGCQGFTNWSVNRYGPQPLVKEAIKKDYNAQNEFMRYLVEVTYGTDIELAPGSDQWYEVAEAGYDFVDQRCDQYLYDLYVRDKERSRNSSLISVTGTAAQAILQTTDVSKATIGVVAALFGLASGANDAVSESYLLSIGPGDVASVVTKSRAKFRAEVKAGQESDQVIRSKATASSSIRSYLELCMPVFIQGQISDYVGKAKATKNEEVAETPSPSAPKEVKPASTATAMPVIQLEQGAE